MRQAREWISRFKDFPVSLTRELVKLSFSRSSGPGGQNVNKVNTKATARCAVKSSWIPLWAHTALRASRYYVKSTDTIVISSMEHRSQAENVEECLTKLRGLIQSCASASLKTETSQAQKERVEMLKQAAGDRRRKEKNYRSARKRSRKGDWE
ncbi:hypothetical protein FISHEDRAFT_39595 [Fistulina hepatica ATCC 64428]|uniref:Prokaryotic-type class I peptide chain release factors domain-containing protein n=1 Tax=Fistulina hepatica ATCC 64428 TaxID=1128425 RepID=A0A0D7AFM4_9AGAR|nr:hypothetical protein FISHEDRAFT_39595 [Fistulina hepatica ATCC 64428]